MNTLPLWIQTLQALLTPAIAIGVGVIAYMQWRTAHQRFVLDLFERRMEVYEEVRSVVSRVNASGEADDEASRELLMAIEKASFLFGQDITDYLETMRLQLIQLHLNRYERDMEGANPEQRRKIVQERTDLFKSITNFYHHGPELFGHYMRMPHKSRRSPIELLRDKWRQRRKSFGNEC